MSVAIVGPLCFGILMGWVTYGALRREREAIAVSSIVAVAGASIMALAGGSKLFAWYGIGLAGGFFAPLVFAYAREVRWRHRESILRAQLSDRAVLASHIPALDMEEFLQTLERRSLSVPDQQSRTRPHRRTSRTQRFANATLFSRNHRLSPRLPLNAHQVVLLRLDIGPLSKESHVTAKFPDQYPPAFPDAKLPEDVELDVMVSSTDFEVALNPQELRPGATVANGRFFLPGSGESATTPSGDNHLYFYLMTPKQPGRASGRIGYYYRNILVQSQHLVADVGQAGGFKIETDFTLSDDLTNLENFPKRPRISILTNANGNGTHQVVLRSPGAHTTAKGGETFTVKDTNIDEAVGNMRKVLRARAPTRRRRRRAELEEDLRQLAWKGFSLWGQVAAQHVHMFGPVWNDPASHVVQICRPTTSGFTFPWSLIYDIPIYEDVKPAMCRLITDWDGERPLVSGLPRQCPHGPHTENILCPFGFWGFRYSIDQLPSTSDSVFSISAPGSWDFVVAETQYGINARRLSDHVDRLRATLGARFPEARIREGKDKNAIRGLLGNDLPLVYFYCHGEKDNASDSETYLGVGRKERIKALDFQGWVQAWFTKENKEIWRKIRPLVFINACHSAEIHPETLVSYLDAFVGTAHAAGVIGTEVKVQQGLAMEVAEKFFGLLLGQGKCVDEALRTIRLDLLADGNLLGLVYTSYCWAELDVTP
jgi:CHAT domain